MSFRAEDRLSRILDGVIVLVVVAIVLAVAYVVPMVVVEARAQARCLAVGWPSSRVTWDFESYCVRRIDQTDMVEKAPR